MKVYSMAIYLNSGNVIRGRFKKFSYEYAEDGTIERLDCVSYDCPALNMINVTTIVALVLEAEEDVDG